MGLAALAALPFHLSVTGWALSLVSGAITSAIGYILWYALLPRISRIFAASVQLAAPPITALGAAIMLGEAIGLRLVVASALIICGNALTANVRPKVT